MIPWKRTQKLVTEYKIDMFHDKNDSVLCAKYRSGYSVQFSCSVMSDSLRPHGLQHSRLPCLSPSSGACPNLCTLSDANQPSHHLSSPSSPASIFPSIRVFYNESVLPIRWPKHLSFTLSFSAPKEYSGLISFRMDWFNLLAVWWTLKNLLQYHSSKTSVLVLHLNL